MDEKHDSTEHMSSTAPTNHSEHTHLPFRSGRHRLRHILRPDGKKVHIAGSPDEFKTLKRTLSTTQPDLDSWEVVIHGSLEHVSLPLSFIHP
jgi:hypothetical protein